MKNLTIDGVLSAGSKIPAWASCWVELNSQRFDAVAETSELPDHSRSACSFQPFACGLARFLIVDPRRKIIQISRQSRWAIAPMV
jgi:hypothetical protein